MLQGAGLYRQSRSDYEREGDAVPPLVVRTSSCAAPAREACIRAEIASSGRVYSFEMRYPVGPGASQALLTAFHLIVDRFRIDGRPTFTPTPTPRDTLGPGPFLSAEEAVSRALAGIPYGPWEVERARLVDEAAARRMNLCGLNGGMMTYGDFAGHPEGVWVVTMRGLMDGVPAVYHTYLDGVLGWHLCTAADGTRPGAATDTPDPAGTSTAGPTPSAQAAPRP